MEGVQSETVEKASQPDAETIDSNLDEPLSPESDGSSNESQFPRLPHDVLIVLSKFLDLKSLKAARAVNTEWNKALAREFRKKTILNADFGYKRPSIYEFINVFTPDATTDNKLIAQSIWIRKSKYLENHSMIKWLESYGSQLTTIKLGNHIKDRLQHTSEKIKEKKKKEFPGHLITSLLINLKVLEILFPYSVTPKKPINISQEEIKVNLELLTIGHKYNNNGKSCCTPPALRGTSGVLLTVLKCLKNLKTLKIVNIASSSFNRIKIPSQGDDHGKKVLENIMEIKLISCTYALHFLGPNSAIKYQHLRSLWLEKLCCTHEEDDEFSLSIYTCVEFGD